MTTKRSASKTNTQPDGKLLIAALDERWENYRMQVKTCRREFSEEAVHDLRVSTRRLLAVLDIARALDPHPRLQKTRRSLKDQIDDLDDLRDVQVMLVEVSETIENFPELKPFEIHLEEREKRLLRLARKLIRALKLSELKKHIEKIRDSLKKQTVKEDFHGLLFQAVDNVYLRTTQALVQVDASQPSTIHRLRLAFKKFRYMVEAVHPLISNYPESHLERMHEYQSAMGDIQDIEVFLNVLSDFSESGASPFDPKPIRHFYQTRHTETIAAFIEDKGELITFWRAASDQHFPWE
ncbi:MAG: CHAD domain-containing protein [Anaerolineales bacterium]